MADIGRNLKVARNKIKIHQAIAAEKMGMSRPTLSAIESNKRKVTAEEIVRFADLYGVDVIELLYDDADARLDRVLSYIHKFKMLSEEDQYRVISFMNTNCVSK